MTGRGPRVETRSPGAPGRDPSNPQQHGHTTRTTVGAAGECHTTALAAPPLLIEATASEKGPLLLKGATEALQACQPYAMLPRDRYGEWKVLDLDFTPRDFAG